MTYLNLFLKRKKQESQQPRKILVRMSSALTDYFTPKQNTEYQRYELCRCLQLPSESLDKFVSRLKALAATCNFTEVDTEVKSQVISGCISQRLRRKGLSEVTWDLSKLIEVGKVYELSDNTALDMRVHWINSKKCITSAPALAYYNPKLETEVYVDASPVGISAILMQKEANSEKRVNVHFASHVLTTTEQRYSQIEREGLAVVWACEHLHIYLYGTDFKIFTDHRPLLLLFTRWQSKPSARL